MPWLSEAHTCPVCGGHHDFCTEDMPNPTRQYAFTCPKEGDGVVTFESPGTFVEDHPQGSVSAKELPPGP